MGRYCKQAGVTEGGVRTGAQKQVPKSSEGVLDFAFLTIGKVTTGKYSRGTSLTVI